MIYVNYPTSNTEKTNTDNRVIPNLVLTWGTIKMPK